MIRLSFRKGGDKALYAVLKRSLLGKAWQVRARAWRRTHDIILTLARPRRNQLANGLRHRARNASVLVRTDNLDPHVGLKEQAVPRWSRAWSRNFYAIGAARYERCAEGPRRPYG